MFCMFVFVGNSCENNHLMPVFQRLRLIKFACETQKPSCPLTDRDYTNSDCANIILRRNPPEQNFGRRNSNFRLLIKGLGPPYPEID